MLQGQPRERTNHDLGGESYSCAHAFLDAHDFAQTHNVALVNPIAEFVVAMDTEGQIISRGSVSEVLANVKDLREDIEKKDQVAAKEVVVADISGGKADKTEIRKNGKLVIAEEVAVGHVSWKSSA
jgi:hypothetical protein